MKHLHCLALIQKDSFSKSDTKSGDFQCKWLIKHRPISKLTKANPTKQTAFKAYLIILKIMLKTVANIERLLVEMVHLLKPFFRDTL